MTDAEWEYLAEGIHGMYVISAALILSRLHWLYISGCPEVFSDILLLQPRETIQHLKCFPTPSECMHYPRRSGPKI